jgi:hypothetical protein
MPVSFQAYTQYLTDNFSFAAHFGSERVKQETSSVQSKFQNMEVYTSTGISVSLSVKQNRREVSINQEEAYFHIVSEGETLQLYVPKSKSRRSVCLATELPVTILKYLGARTPKSGELGAIINAPSLSVVDQLLNIAGIIEVAELQRPDDDQGHESDSSDGGETLVSNSPRPLIASNANLSVRETSEVSIYDGRTVTQFPFTFGGSRSAAPASRSATQIPQVDHYKRLLDVLIQQAQKVSTLPNNGKFIKTPAIRVLSDKLDILLAVESPFGGEKEFKIGAAGELFVSYTIGLRCCLI